MGVGLGRAAVCRPRLDPGFSQQPDFHNLRERQVTNERQQQKQPVKRRQRNTQFEKVSRVSNARFPKNANRCLDSPVIQPE